MPRPNPPPTPGSSSDIRGKDGTSAPPAFHLPPTAFGDLDRNQDRDRDPRDRASTSSATPSANGSDSSYHPTSPTTQPKTSRKRSAPQPGPAVSKDDFTLPPPPTRSRKIIQMKPGETEQHQHDRAPTTSSPDTTTNKTPAASQSSGKRKPNGSSGTTAAGRKIARKTAHSLIERRRRSKMNEEFGVLRDLIPACKGQEMHKLAILQASIEYLRYLEQCVSDLQTQYNAPRPPPASNFTRPQEEEDDEDEEMEDEPDEGTASSTPVTTAMDHSGSNVSLPSLSQITHDTTSPSIFSSGAGRHYSISSASQASYSPYFHSNQTSPAFGPQLSHMPTAPPLATNSSLGSPALKPTDHNHNHNNLRAIAEGAADLSDKLHHHAAAPQREGRRSEHELDHEASAALLMLNHDRRKWPTSLQENGNSRSSRNGKAVGAGMSVKDLLSG